MSRKTVKIDRSLQFDLLGENPTSSTDKHLNVAASRRTFIAPDRHELFLGMTPLDRYLERTTFRGPGIGRSRLV